MKVTVSRKLSAGIYFVSFRVGEFTPEESQKMQSFGIPRIQLQQGPANGPRTSTFLPLNQITEQAVGGRVGFSTSEEAKKYEEGVLEQIRTAMASLRERKDDFTSTDEVAL